MIIPQEVINDRFAEPLFKHKAQALNISIITVPSIINKETLRCLKTNT